MLLLDSHLLASMIANVVVKAVWCPLHPSFYSYRDRTCTLDVESAAHDSTRIDKACMFLAASSTALSKYLESPTDSCK